MEFDLDTSKEWTYAKKKFKAWKNVCSKEKKTKKGEMDPRCREGLKSNGLKESDEGKAKCRDRWRLILKEVEDHPRQKRFVSKY